MRPTLPEALETDLRPLFDALPLSKAMTQLVIASPVHAAASSPEASSTTPDDSASPDLIALVENILKQPLFANRSDLAAGLWLYVDELDRSHQYSQDIDMPRGSFWHGIMHRREGDFSNSHYWLRKVGHHPAMDKIDISGGPCGAGGDVGSYEPHRFIDQVAEAYSSNQSPANLIALQQAEWASLFEYCAAN